MEVIETVIRHGVPTLARPDKRTGFLYPVTYANRTQAQACVDKLGPGWFVRQNGRPFVVIHDPDANACAA